MGGPGATPCQSLGSFLRAPRSLYLSPPSSCHSGQSGEVGPQGTWAGAWAQAAGEGPPWKSEAVSPTHVMAGGDFAQGAQ